MQPVLTIRRQVASFGTAAFVAYVTAAVLPHLWALVTYDEYWRSAAPATAGFMSCFLVALVSGRKWAWIALVLLDIAVLGAIVAAGGPLPAGLLAAIRLGILLSPRVRRHVGLERLGLPDDR